MGGTISTGYVPNPAVGLWGPFDALEAGESGTWAPCRWSGMRSDSSICELDMLLVLLRSYPSRSEFIDSGTWEESSWS